MSKEKTNYNSGDVPQKERGFQLTREGIPPVTELIAKLRENYDFFLRDGREGNYLDIETLRTQIVRARPNDIRPGRLGKLFLRDRLWRGDHTARHNRTFET